MGAISEASLFLSLRTEATAPQNGAAPSACSRFGENRGRADVVLKWAEKHFIESQ